MGSILSVKFVLILDNGPKQSDLRACARAQNYLQIRLGVPGTGSFRKTKKINAFLLKETPAHYIVLF